MTIKNPYIVYSLPTSKIWHPLKSKKLNLAWQDIKDSFDNVTTASSQEPNSIQIQISFYRNSSDLEDAMLMAIPELMEDPQLKNLIKNGIPQQRLGVWEIESENLNSALQYFEKIQPTLKNNYDIQLYVHYAFKLVDPLSHNLLESQELISHFTFYFARTHTCLPTIFFPFSEANEDFWKYYDSIKQYFPFIIDEKYLKLARLKNGRPTSFKKVSRQ